MNNSIRSFRSLRTLSAIAGLGFLSLAPIANADVVLTGGNITITETSAAVGTDGQYVVDNGTTDLTLFAFGVSNNNTVSVSQGFVNASDGASIGWDVDILDSSTWDGYEVIDPDFNFITLDTFGSFTDFFDINDSVNFYSASESDLLNPGASVSEAFFFSPNLADSTAVAFGALSGGGNSSVALTTSAVPVPAAVWLFGSGLLGLVGVARRKTISAR